MSCKPAPTSYINIFSTNTQSQLIAIAVLKIPQDTPPPRLYPNAYTIAPFLSTSLCGASLAPPNDRRSERPLYKPLTNSSHFHDDPCTSLSLNSSHIHRLQELGDYAGFMAMDTTMTSNWHQPVQSIGSSKGDGIVFKHAALVVFAAGSTSLEIDPARDYKVYKASADPEHPDAEYPSSNHPLRMAMLIAQHSASIPDKYSITYTATTRYEMWITLVCEITGLCGETHSVLHHPHHTQVGSDGIWCPQRPASRSGQGGPRSCCPRHGQLQGVPEGQAKV